MSKSSMPITSTDDDQDQTECIDINQIELSILCKNISQVNAALFDEINDLNLKIKNLSDKMQRYKIDNPLRKHCAKYFLNQASASTIAKVKIHDESSFIMQSTDQLKKTIKRLNKESDDLRFHINLLKDDIANIENKIDDFGIDLNRLKQKQLEYARYESKDTKQYCVPASSLEATFLYSGVKRRSDQDSMTTRPDNEERRKKAKNATSPLLNLYPAHVPQQAPLNNSEELFAHIKLPNDFHPNDREILSQLLAEDDLTSILPSLGFK